MISNLLEAYDESQMEDGDTRLLAGRSDRQIQSSWTQTTGKEDPRKETPPVSRRRSSRVSSASSSTSFGEPESGFETEPLFPRCATSGSPSSAQASQWWGNRTIAPTVSVGSCDGIGGPVVGVDSPRKRSLSRSQADVDRIEELRSSVMKHLQKIEKEASRLETARRQFSNLPDSERGMDGANLPVKRRNSSAIENTTNGVLRQDEDPGRLLPASISLEENNSSGVGTSGKSLEAESEVAKVSSRKSAAPQSSVATSGGGVSSTTARTTHTKSGVSRSSSPSSPTLEPRQFTPVPTLSAREAALLADRMSSPKIKRAKVVTAPNPPRSNDMQVWRVLGHHESSLGASSWDRTVKLDSSTRSNPNVPFEVPTTADLFGSVPAQLSSQGGEGVLMASDPLRELCGSRPSPPRTDESFGRTLDSINWPLPPLEASVYSTMERPHPSASVPLTISGDHLTPPQLALSTQLPLRTTTSNNDRRSCSADSRPQRPSTTGNTTTSRGTVSRRGSSHRNRISARQALPSEGRQATMTGVELQSRRLIPSWGTQH